jgi:mutator protein MutT
VTRHKADDTSAVVRIDVGPLAAWLGRHRWWRVTTGVVAGAGVACVGATGATKWMSATAAGSSIGRSKSSQRAAASLTVSAERSSTPKTPIFHRVSRIHVVAAVISREGRYLACRRPAHKRHGGLWEFPGGKLEPGESFFDAARRELREELAVEVTAVLPALLSVADAGSAFIIDFVPTEIIGDPTCVEHSELRWVTPAELDELDLAPSDRRFADSLLEDLGRTPSRSDESPRQSS